jgi:hypothetical protein
VPGLLDGLPNLNRLVQQALERSKRRPQRGAIGKPRRLAAHQAQ